MGSVKLSRFAEAELDDIAAFISMDSLDRADRFMEASAKTLNLLAQFPELGRLRTFKNQTLPEIRSFRIKGFENILAFYRPARAGIEVLHVLHGARDLESFFDDTAEGDQL